MEQTEYTLDAKQCAEVALYMYKQWQEAMKPPLFVYTQFDGWLQGLIDGASASASERPPERAKPSTEQQPSKVSLPREGL